MKKPATKDLIFVSIQLALFIAFLIPVSLFPFHINDVLKYTSLLLSSIGFVTIFVAFIQLDKNLTPFPTPKKNGSLIQTGLYKLVRHPIYSGIIITTVFFGLYQQSFWKISIGFSLWILFYFKSEYEEKLLSNQFNDYQKYKESTKRFFPFL